MRYQVIYNDPRRRRYGAESTLHRAGCRHVSAALAVAGATVLDIDAPTVTDALIIAQYQGLDHADDPDWDLGAVDPAPCVEVN